MARAWILVAGVAVVAACTEPPPPGPWTCSREEQHELPFYTRPPVDLVIVVDRTPSMTDQAAHLHDATIELVHAVEQLGGGAPDLHVAVVSSDLGGRGVDGCTTAGDRARFVDGASCGVDGGFVRDAPADGGGRVHNHGGDLAGTLACLVDLPPSTCPVSQPLAAAIGALDGSEPGNDGFRRTRAQLVILVVTDGDDCSLVDRDALADVAGVDLEAAVDVACFARGVRCEPDQPHATGLHTGCVPRTGEGLADVAATFDVLRQLGGGRVAVGLIAGPAEVTIDPGPRIAPACSSDGAVGPAPRLAALTGDWIAHTDACAANWSDALVWIASPWFPPIGLCLSPGVDLEPDVPGVQARCSVTLGTGQSSDGFQPIVTAASCAEPSRDPDAPCYRLLDDAPDCHDAVTFRVELGPSTPFNTGIAQVRCELACDAPDGAEL